MKKILIFTLLLMSAATFAQPRRHQPQVKIQFMNFELHVFPSDSSNIIFFTYRIPYNRFVFVKDNNQYSAQFTLGLEVEDKDSKFVTREIKDGKITTSDFDKTISKDLFKQGIIKLKLASGIYKAEPIVSDLNSNREIRLHPFIMHVPVSDSSTYLHPIVVNSIKIKCHEDSAYHLTNFNNNIPFNESKYDLVIPVSSNSVSEIYYKIVSNKDTLQKGVLKNPFASKIYFEKCNSDLIILAKGNETKLINNFILKNFSDKLPEGPFELYLSADKNFKKKKKFVMLVHWNDKPISLMNPEQAIKDLKFIEKQSVIDTLLDYDSDKYYQVLNKYWRKYDPTPKTKFNPLMEEYYWRIDYAARNFAPVSRKSGLTTDRAKIFIKYGKPSKVERSSNKYGKVVEKWIFDKSQKVFVFVDKDGTGNFILEKS